MQTFLPFQSFTLSAAVLDNRRLGKQMIEAATIYQVMYVPGTGWHRHPATRMWVGYHEALALYGLACYWQWQQRLKLGMRGGKLWHVSGEFFVGLPLNRLAAMPPWLGNEAFHRSHRSNLLRKKPEWYRLFFNDVDNLPYVWPKG